MVGGGETVLCDRLTLLVCMVDIEEGDVISVDVSKPHLGLVRLLLLVPWSDEHLRNCMCVQVIGSIAKEVT